MMARYWAIRVVVQVRPLVASVQIAASSNGVHDGCVWSSAVQKSLGSLPPGVKRQTAPALPPAGVVVRRLTVDEHATRNSLRSFIPSQTSPVLRPQRPLEPTPVIPCLAHGDLVP